MKQLLVASTNKGKVQEYQSLLAGLPMAVLSLAEMGIHDDVEEHGSTFAENAEIKARAYAQAGGLLTLSDDSGLCVDALGGAPGLFSARYGPDSLARIERLLSELRDVPDERRTARFVCVIALAEPDGAVHTFEGVCQGRIARQPAGQSGFGYDPIFLVEGYGRTMAELPTEVKNRVSHRGRAIVKARAWLMEWLQSAE